MGSFGSCPDCPKGTRDVLLIAGKCKGHFKNIQGAGDRERAPQILKEKAKKEKIKSLSVFFKEQIKIAPKRCENCNGKIIIVDPLPKSTMIAHIVPKRSVKSISTNPLNVWFACGDCHTNYDQGGSKKVLEMPILKTAKQRLAKIYHLIPIEERRFVPEYLKPNE